MKFSASLHRRLHWLNLPGALLIALLQRTPIIRVAAVAEDLVIASPVGTILKSAVATLASLGAINSLAGATTLSATTASPASATVGVAKTIAFDVKGADTPALSWTVGGSVPPGMTFKPLNDTGAGVSSGIVNASTLQLSGTPTTAGPFVISLKAWEGLNGTLTNVTFSYTVNVAAAANTAPTITGQPTNQIANVGGAVVFFVTAAGSPTPTFQWLKNTVAITGATSSSLTLSNLTTADAGSYTCVATNSFGSATSNAATLTVTGGGTPVPVITAQPASRTISPNSTVVFSMTATGATSYQWRKDGVVLTGATAPTLVLASATATQAGSYICTATNAGGGTASTAATLTFSSTADFGRIINLAVRTNSGAGDQVLNVGLTVGGGGTTGVKPLLVRVTGPALAAFGVSGTMLDPTLALQAASTGASAGFNDNWNGDATVAATAAAVGAFPLIDTKGKDAALVGLFSNGGYTALAAGAGGTTGIVLTEIYDASSSVTATTPRLINVAARAQVNTGDDVLIAGFVIGGSTAKTVLIRATGPALTAFGVGGVLTDPKLELFNSASALLTSNDNWGGDAALVSTSAAVGAFALANTASKDAVLLVTLPPDSYTAKVSGVNNGTGVALIEVYEVP